MPAPVQTTGAPYAGTAGSATAGTLYPSWSPPVLVVPPTRIIAQPSIILQQTFDGGTGAGAGTTLSAVNTDGPGNTPLNQVSIGASATAVFDATASDGTLGAQFTTPVTATTVYCSWTTAWATQTTTFMWADIRLEAAPTATIRIFGALVDGATLGAIVTINTSRQLIIANSAGTAIYTSAVNAVPIGQFFRLEFGVTHSATTGTAQAKIYNTLSSATADVDSGAITGANTGVQSTIVRYGIGQSGASLSVRIDRIGASNVISWGKVAAAGASPSDVTLTPATTATSVPTVDVSIPGAPWVRNSTQSGTGAGTSLSHSVVIPACQTGDDLWASFTLNSGHGVVTGPVGWTNVHTALDANGTMSLLVYRKTATATEVAGGSVTVTVATAVRGNAGAVSIANADTGALDGSVAAAGTGNVTTATSFSTTVLNTLVLTVVAIDSGTEAVTPPSGTVERWDPTASGITGQANAGATLIKSTTGSSTWNWSWTTAGLDYKTWAGAIKPAAVATGVTLTPAVATTVTSAITATPQPVTVALTPVSRTITAVTLSVVAGATSVTLTPAIVTSSTVTVTPLTKYDAAVLADSPIAFFDVDGTTTTDRSGNGHALSYVGGTPGTLTLPNGQKIATFNGSTQYAEITDANDLSVPGAGGILTLEAWFSPSVLDQPGAEASADGPFVHWMGKGVGSQQEYAARFYDLNSTRPNRVSGYSFNLGGGQGAGSYWQGGTASTNGGTPPLMSAGDLIHYVLKIDTVNLGGDSWGTTKVYRNGVLMDTDTLGAPYNITPSNGTSPLRIGTRDLASFFKGAAGKIAVYGNLSDARILAHYQAMGAIPSTTLSPTGVTVTAVAVTATPGPTSVTLTPATISAAAFPLGIGGVSVVALSAAVATSSALAITATPGPVSVTLTSAVTTTTARTLTLSSGVVLGRAAATFTAAPLILTVGPTAVTLAQAVITFTAVGISSGGASVISLTPAALALTARSLTAASVAPTVVLTTAVFTITAPSVTATAGIININIVPTQATITPGSLSFTSVRIVNLVPAQLKINLSTPVASVTTPGVDLMTIAFATVTGVGEYVRGELEGTEGGVPQRFALIVPGSISWDNCDCGQFAQTITNVVSSRAFPTPATDAPMMPCGHAEAVISVTVSLLRCVPGMDSNGNSPSVDSLLVSARIIEEDRLALRRGVATYLYTLHQNYKITNYTIGAAQSVGPEGQCGGIELAYSFGIMNDAVTCG